MKMCFAPVKTRLEYAWETTGKTADDIKVTLQRIVEERCGLEPPCICGRAALILEGYLCTAAKVW